jgi:hypothetical protein
MVVSPATAGIGGELVQGTVGDLGVVFHQSLGAVAVVNIPVEDGYPLNPGLLDGVMGRDRRIGQQAKAHAAIADGMVPRRPSQNKGGLSIL